MIEKMNFLISFHSEISLHVVSRTSVFVCFTYSMMCLHELLRNMEIFLFIFLLGRVF